MKHVKLIALIILSLVASSAFTAPIKGNELLTVLFADNVSGICFSCK